MNSPSPGLMSRLERLIGFDLRYALQSGFWLNAGSGVSMLGAFLVSIAFANLLSKESFGTYQYLLAIFALLNTLTLTGANTAITRAVAQGDDDALRASIRPQLVWNSFSAGIALLLSGYYWYMGDLRLGTGTLLIALALPVIATFNSYSAFLIGKKAFRTHFLYSTAGNLLYYAAIIATLMVAPAVVPLIAVNLFMTAATPMIAYVATVRAFRLGTPAGAGSLSYGKHLSVMNLFAVVALQIDSFLVFHFLGPVQLAVYSIATLIPDRLGGLFKNLMYAALPRFSVQPWEQLRANIMRKAAVAFVFVAAVTFAYIAAIPTLFSVLYPQYLEAVPYAQVFALTLFVAVANFMGSVLLAHERIRRLYLVSTVPPAASLILQLVGITLWGLWGLIIARLLATGVFFLIVFLAVFGRHQSPSEHRGQVIP